MRDAYVGFYWTLPVNSHGFRTLPNNVDAAAKASRTIRYQRERIRQHVCSESGELVGEIAYMDTQPDRATEAVREALKRAASYADHATLLLVDFSVVNFWRRIPQLSNYVAHHGLKMYTLEPRPIMIESQIFDPIEHFETWRKRDESAMAGFRLSAYDGLQAALLEEPAGAGRWKRICERLNRQGIKTLRGGGWTPENVRKLSLRAYANL